MQWRILLTNQIPPFNAFMKTASYPKGYGFWKDNPGGDWLDFKQQLATEDMEDGFHGKNEPTAGFENPINIDVDDLLSLEGYSGEHESIQENDKQVLEMAEDMKENGYTGGAVMIWITMFGRVGLAEGNHRVRAAKLAGLSSVPTTVKYFDGAEDILEEQNSPWSPNNIVSKIKESTQPKTPEVEKSLPETKERNPVELLINIEDLMSNL